MRKLDLKRERRRSRSHRPAAGALLAGILLTFPVAARPVGSGVVAQTIFPVVTTDALDKQRVTLPTDLEGQANLLLLSFAPDQANQLETWTAVAQALQHTQFTFRTYRIPVAERENALFRWWANASLRSSETDPELWHWVVPIYVEKQAFRAQLGIADEKSVVALLVDRGGHVLWRATGVSSPGSRASLAAATVAATGTDMR